MLKAIRYTLAAICLVASVGCLALWWLSIKQRDLWYGTSYVSSQHSLIIETLSGTVTLAMVPSGGKLSWNHFSTVFTLEDLSQIRQSREMEVKSGFDGMFVRFSLWYPALVFALAAVAAIRVGRFTLRSALVGMSVVAALLGMVVAL